MTELQIVGGDQQPSCIHHWLLGDPAGGVILGRCRHCHSTRAYAASPESNDRFDDYRELTASSSYNADLKSASISGGRSSSRRRSICSGSR